MGGSGLCSHIGICHIGESKRGAFGKEFPVQLHCSVCSAATLDFEGFRYGDDLVEVDAAEAVLIAFDGFKHGLLLISVTADH